MTPIFALSLSFDGIRLLHRTPEGWTPLGEVPLDARDLPRSLAALRRAGLALGVPWRGTKLLLPAEQIRVLSLEGEQGPEAARAALEGATPYAVADLVIDQVQAGGRTHVAAVARETLEEAESFAAEHGFSPVCFAALPGRDFPGEAFFGPTKMAASLLGGEVVTREGASPAEPAADPVASAVAPHVVPEIARPAPATPQVEPAPAPLTAPIFAGRAPQPLRGPSRPGAAAPATPVDAKPVEALATPGPKPLPSAGAATRPAVAAPVPPRRKDPSPDAAAIPVFGAGKAEAPGVGRTRRMALALGLAAAIPVGALAVAWTLPGDSLAGLFGQAPEVAAASPVVAPAPAALSEQVADSPASVDLPSAEAPVGEAALGASPETPVAPDAAPVQQATAEVTPDPDATQEAAAAVAAAIAALPQGGTEDPDAGLPETSPLETAALETADIETADIEGRPVAVVTPEEADRFYAATGVWLRAPRLPLLPEAGAPLQAALSADPAKAAVVALPTLPATTPDEPLATVQAPPAPGTRAPLDERGFVQATPEGAPTASGVLVIAGPPAIVPPTRPGTEPPAPEPVRDDSGWLNAMAEPPALEPRLRPAGLAGSEIAAEPGVPAETDAAEASAWVNAMAEPPTVVPPPRPAAPASAVAEPQDPALSDGAAPAWVNAMAEPPAATPPLRPAAPEELLAALAPGAEAVPTDPEADPTAALAFGEALAGAEAPTPGGVSLAGLRPSARPDGLAPEVPEVLAQFDGPRPGARPEGLVPEMPPAPDVTDALNEALAAAAPPAAAVPATPDVNDALAAIMQNAPDPLAGATPRAVAVARVPDARPRNFDRVVRDQLARQARASQTQQAPTGQASAGAVANSDLSRNEQAEAGEAEVASSAAAVPSGPTATTVAAAATFADAMALREINLIGVYGQPGARRALVRMGNGRYLRVGVGDELDGGQVTAIGDNVLNYVKRGRTEVLVIPGG